MYAKYNCFPLTALRGKFTKKSGFGKKFFRTFMVMKATTQANSLTFPSPVRELSVPGPHFPQRPATPQTTSPTFPSPVPTHFTDLRHITPRTGDSTSPDRRHITPRTGDAADQKRSHTTVPGPRELNWPPSFGMKKLVNPADTSSRRPGWRPGSERPDSPCSRACRRGRSSARRPHPASAARQ